MLWSTRIALASTVLLLSIPFAPYSAAKSSGPIWRPAPATTFQWQLSDGPVDRSVAASVYDIDVVDNDARIVAALHAAGRHVICYVDVGSYEDWRPDRARFLAHRAVLGKPYADWAGEWWLDIRRLDILGPIMRARLDRCKAKGFDAVEPDNIDGYANETGFPLRYEDQLRYNRWLAGEAHRRGLSIGLKNDGDQVGDLFQYFDWALTEDCFNQGWCSQVMPFLRAGKAVFAVEYDDVTTRQRFDQQFCSRARQARFTLILKHRGLDRWRHTCGQ